MTQLQAIRGRLEAVTRDALADGGIDRVVFDNTLETPPRLPYAVVSLSFGAMVAPSLGCAADHIRGAMVVTIFTGKAQGSVPGETAALEVLRAWVAMGQDYSEPVRLRTYNEDGPRTVDPGELPAHIHTLNCGFIGRG